MSIYKGTVRLTGMISPKDTTDTYPTHSSSLGLGGHRTVETLDDRDAIPTNRQEQGMTVFVKENGITYILKDSWKEHIPNGGAISLTDIDDSVANIGIMLFTNTANINKIIILGVNA